MTKSNTWYYCPKFDASSMPRPRWRAAVFVLFGFLLLLGIRIRLLPVSLNMHYLPHHTLKATLTKNHTDTTSEVSARSRLLGFSFRRKSTSRENVLRAPGTAADTTSEVSTHVTSAWPYKPIFLINEPGICSNSSARSSNHGHFLIYIHTSPANADRRAFLRQTWADSHFKLQYNFITVFILGHPDNTTIQKQVDNESRTFHDIIQADFKDSYKNLTFKEVAALYWASTYCPEATFVVKADDDLIIKPWLLMDTLRNHLKDSTKPMLFCKRCVNDYVHRDKKSKWFVPLSVYPNITFPTFCAGPLRIMTKAAVSLLAQGTQKTFYITLEDVFATGFVAEKMGVSRVHEPYLLMEQNLKYRLPPYVPMKFVAAHAHSLQNQRKIWAEVVKKYPQQVSR